MVGNRATCHPKTRIRPRIFFGAWPVRRSLGSGGRLARSGPVSSAPPPSHWPRNGCEGAAPPQRSRLNPLSVIALGRRSGRPPSILGLAGRPQPVPDRCCAVAGCHCHTASEASMRALPALAAHRTFRSVSPWVDRASSRLSVSVSSCISCLPVVGLRRAKPGTSLGWHGDPSAPWQIWVSTPRTKLEPNKGPPGPPLRSHRKVRRSSRPIGAVAKKQSCPTQPLRKN